MGLRLSEEKSCAPSVGGTHACMLLYKPEAEQLVLCDVRIGKLKAYCGVEGGIEQERI